MNVALLAGIASMVAAMGRGDVDEAARQGALAGPAVVEEALASEDRMAVLAGIAAAPHVTAKAELLPALAKLAAGPDRRTAIPAAQAGVAIARDLAKRGPDDEVAPADLADAKAAFLALAARKDRWIEVRTRSLEAAVVLQRAIDPDAAAYDLSAALADPDAAYRLAAVELVAVPVAAPLAAAVSSDPDPHVALAAGQVLCATGDVSAAVSALGEGGVAKLRTLTEARDAPKAAVRDIARCLVKR